MEIWKDIPGFEGFYQASSYGNIKSLYFNKLLKFDKKINGAGYYNVNLSIKAIIYARDVHRLIALTFLESNLENPHVNHKDGNKKNNRLDNLELVSRSGNMKHAWDTGLCGDKLKYSQLMSGENNIKSKLVESQVLEIRNLLKLGYKPKVVAEKFNISIPTISDIKNGKTWRNLL